MDIRDYRYSPLVVSLWFNGFNAFCDRARPADHDRLQRLFKLTLDLEAAVNDYSQLIPLSMLDGTSPSAIYPEGSAPIKIYRELLAELDA